MGPVIAQGSQFGIGTYFMKFSREYEKQADILGSQIMAAAGYDPRDMANVFKTIEKESGPGGPQWMSDHPNPGNRYDYINQEAQIAARVAEPAPRHAGSSRARRRTCARCRRRRRPRKWRATATRAARTGSGGAPAARARPGNVPRPDSRYDDLQRRQPVPRQRAVELAGDGAATTT